MIKYTDNRNNAWIQSFVPGRYVSACGRYSAGRQSRRLWAMWPVGDMFSQDWISEGRTLTDLLAPLERITTARASGEY